MSHKRSSSPLTDAAPPKVYVGGLDDYSIEDVYDIVTRDRPDLMRQQAEFWHEVSGMYSDQGSTVRHRSVELTAGGDSQTTRAVSGNLNARGRDLDAIADALRTNGDQWSKMADAVSSAQGHITDLHAQYQVEKAANLFSSADEVRRHKDEYDTRARHILSQHVDTVYRHYSRMRMPDSYPEAPTAEQLARNSSTRRAIGVFRTPGHDGGPGDTPTHDPAAPAGPSGSPPGPVLTTPGPAPVPAAPPAPTPVPTPTPGPLPGPVPVAPIPPPEPPGPSPVPRPGPGIEPTPRPPARPTPAPRPGLEPEPPSGIRPGPGGGRVPAGGPSRPAGTGAPRQPGRTVPRVIGERPGKAGPPTPRSSMEEPARAVSRPVIGGRPSPGTRAVRPKVSGIDAEGVFGRRAEAPQPSGRPGVRAPRLRSGGERLNRGVIGGARQRPVAEAGASGSVSSRKKHDREAVGSDGPRDEFWALPEVSRGVIAPEDAGDVEHLPGPTVYGTRYRPEDAW